MKRLIEVRVQQGTFTKPLKDKETMVHHARIITYVDDRKHRLVSLLTNDIDDAPSLLIAIYRQR